ncbi:hypothetical protein WDW37_06190 [Bdellovibrionota bacterium FG-1]
MRILNGSILLSGAYAALLLSGCVQQDYYSQVLQDCNYPVKNLGTHIPDSKQTETTLTDACKTALEAILPYDDSFQNAPTGFKDKVTEAFQALIAYPLLIPKENTLLGVAPVPAGAIDMDLIDLFKDYSNPNQSLFNSVLNQFRTITFSSDTSLHADAAWGPDADTLFINGSLTIYPPFWNPKSLPEAFVNPFNRASTLVHESRHANHFDHIACNDPNSPGLRCDYDLKGAWGFSITYLHYLLQGSPDLPPANVAFIGVTLVDILKRHVNHPFSELADIISKITPLNVTADWVREHEGLPPYTKNTD